MVSTTVHTRFTSVVCLECQHEMAADTMVAACPNCGSAWVDARYDYAGIPQQWDADLKNRTHSLWRYAELLPISEPHPDIWMGEGWTPLIRLGQYERLFQHEKIFIKDERQSPTSSFKDRQAALSVTALKRAGIKEVVLASTGNAGVAYAAYCARAGIKLWLFVNSLVPDEKMREAAIYGTEVIKIDGTYDEAKHVAGEFARFRGYHYDKGAKSVPGKESMKTIAFEIAEQLGLYLDGASRWMCPDWYIQAVSGGIGPLGAWKGFNELYHMGMIDKLPKLGIIQAAGCAPMVRAHHANLPVAEPVVPETLITVLATGEPGYSYVQLHDAIVEYGGAMAAVEDGDAFNAMRHLAARAGLSVEPATAVAFAGLEKFLTEGVIEPGEVVVVNTTGHTLPAESHILGNQYVIDLEASQNNSTHILNKGNLAEAMENISEQVTTVLVVDDNNNDRRLMRKLLRRYKQYRMLEARSGAEALDVLRDRKPDLIVSDLTMPEMDGFVMIENLKSDPDTAHIPVVVVSAKSRTGDEDALLKRYAESVWVKGDFSRRDLVDHIVATLGDRPIQTGKLKPVGARIQQPTVVNASIIVAINDDVDDLQMIQSLLETDHSNSVIALSDSRSGLKAIHENHPDLVILEVAMPDIDGFTLIDKIKNDPTLNHIPVVVFTRKELAATDIAAIYDRAEKIFQKASLDRVRFLSIINDILR